MPPLGTANTSPTTQECELSSVEPFVQPPDREPVEDPAHHEPTERSEQPADADPARDSVFRRPDPAAETPEESARHAAESLEE